MHSSQTSEDAPMALTERVARAIHAAVPGSGSWDEDPGFGMRFYGRMADAAIREVALWMNSDEAAQTCPGMDRVQVGRASEGIVAALTGDEVQ